MQRANPLLLSHSSHEDANSDCDDEESIVSYTIKKGAYCMKFCLIQWIQSRTMSTLGRSAKRKTDVARMEYIVADKDDVIPVVVIMTIIHHNQEFKVSTLFVSSDRSSYSDGVLLEIQLLF